jgi:hypothetical protein
VQEEVFGGTEVLKKNVYDQTFFGKKRNHLQNVVLEKLSFF